MQPAEAPLRVPGHLVTALTAYRLRAATGSLDMDSADHLPLCEDETLRRSRTQEEFIARGLRSSEDAQRTGLYHRAETVHDELQRRLDAQRKAILG